jgi:hypothetical protein
MAEMSDFDAGLSKMGLGIRRAPAGFREADEGFRRADEGFIEALEALKVVTLARGTLDERWREMVETIARLETLVLAQGDEVRALRDLVDKPTPPPA